MKRVRLALECSQREGSVAIAVDQQAPCAQAITPKQHKDDDLMPAIDRLLQQVGVVPNELQMVAVSIGPGGFTGLRISIATAQMLGRVLSAALVAVPSALVAAETIDHEGPMVICLASKRSTLWATRVERRDGHWHIPQPGGLVEASDLSLDGITAVVADGHIPDALSARVEEQELPVIDPVFEATACLAVADRMLDAEQTVLPHQLLPLYPRPAEAVRLHEQRMRPGHGAA